MKKLTDKNKIIKSQSLICAALDSHKWATKMEVIRLVSGKPDLRIKATLIHPS